MYPLVNLTMEEFGLRHNNGHFVAEKTSGYPKCAAAVAPDAPRVLARHRRFQDCGGAGLEIDAVWVSDWGANAILRFEPKTEKFESVPLPDRDASVRQLAGRKGEVWGAESGADKLFMIKSE
jgi:hypothetical protein